MNHNDYVNTPTTYASKNGYLAAVLNKRESLCRGFPNILSMDMVSDNSSSTLSGGCLRAIDFNWAASFRGRACMVSVSKFQRFQQKGRPTEKSVGTSLKNGGWLGKQ